MTETLAQHARIMVIDDDPDLLLLLTRMLTRIGITPVTAETGAAGVKILNEQKFDLLILDLMLPDIGGFEILKRLRAEERFNDLPILILSARADPDTISQGLELGADGYLTKPYLPNTLTSRVRALLEQGRRKPG